MINERPATGGLEAKRDLLTRIDQRQPAAAERAGCGVEVDVVRKRIGIGIDQRRLEVVAFMAANPRIDRGYSA